MPTALTVVGLTVLLVGCGSVSPTASRPAISAPAVTAPTPVPGSRGPSQPPASTIPGQTDTAWGRIWDGLPPSFPRYPGSEPTETRTGPVTATLAVPAEQKTVVDWMKTALERGGYSTEAVSKPLEDGSIVIDSVGTTSGCRVEITLLPEQQTTIATILLAAACAFR